MRESGEFTGMGRGREEFTRSPRGRVGCEAFNPLTAAGAIGLSTPDTGKLCECSQEGVRRGFGEGPEGVRRGSGGGLEGVRRGSGGGP
eukprot:1180520-Prorocentrum_minimum.AAC.2